MKNNSKKPTSAYIHIPFCTQICYYCDFAKVYIQNQPVDAYLTTLLAEFDAQNIGALNTIYIGGGTPTALTAAQLDTLLSGITRHLDLTQLKEFTVEANPGDLSDDKIAVLKKHHVNRVSLGVQTFNDQLLKKIGRSHTAQDVFDNIEKLKAAGFDNITIDLIYALPGQTMADVKKDVATLLSLDLPHVALYSLILENHTIFMNKMRRGKLDLPSDDSDFEMYNYIIDSLETAGYAHYEISNFGKKGFESAHNLMYWDNAEYYGFGAGASGYVSGIRYKNHVPIHHYLENDDKRAVQEKLTMKEQMEEELFLGLRKKSGVNTVAFNRKFNQDFDAIYGETVTKLIEKQLLSRNEAMIFLTRQGLMLGNDVFEAFLLDDIT
ncbi:oxygen-independent coproporphyrinogen III oxidase [Lactococcus piscium]|uniref:Heme chaperone HemW n=1 Tax=Pseudolactococcus paracarnosus TaxID=2749962 RepID=A0A7L4WD72_9LACT|nr:radical SAM family heme chaperone HemW [Lactococcus paracarnosus]MCJ1994518.1 oxygen-independent coproporphyrinogen III oxidase [Lactococcus paracarnosus]QDJ27864.1 coproporphyrinogen III oxidase [Lactococcus paracarnosus]SPC35776.1 Oxygen-independent coproporphyrinogen-III oxidase 1 [Lactococcus piscium]